MNRSLIIWIFACSCMAVYAQTSFDSLSEKEKEKAIKMMNETELSFHHSTTDIDIIVAPGIALFSGAQKISVRRNSETVDVYCITNGRIYDVTLSDSCNHAYGIIQNFSGNKRGNTVYGGSERMVSIYLPDENDPLEDAHVQTVVEFDRWSRPGEEVSISGILEISPDCSELAVNRLQRLKRRSQGRTPSSTSRTDVMVFNLESKEFRKVNYFAK